MLDAPKSFTYRGFSVEILPRKGFAGLNWYYFEISGNGLKYPIRCGVGEQAESIALDEAKEFIDEHLVHSKGEQ